MRSRWIRSGREGGVEGSSKFEGLTKGEKNVLASAESEPRPRCAPHPPTPHPNSHHEPETFICDFPS